MQWMKVSSDEPEVLRLWFGFVVSAPVMFLRLRGGAEFL